MRVADFDFELPEENIALRPMVPRDHARLLCVDGRAGDVCGVHERSFLSDRYVGDLADVLREGDVLVFNDTKVIPAQLEGTRQRGQALAQVGATLHMCMSDNRWRAFVRGAKKLKIGDDIVFKQGVLSAKVLEKQEGGEVELLFDRAGPALDRALVEVGHVPLPPYIASKRQEDEQDKKDYQTIYAEKEGAVAAPTAGLHFTDELFQRLQEKNIAHHFLTLHVGAGTFLPVKVEDTRDHKMHHEVGEISAETAEALNQARIRGGRIVAVGTTSLRLLESAVDDKGFIQPWSGATDIFITPGYQFRAVDVLMTNFHLPRSTLFMLVSAFAGKKTMQSAYAHAIKTGYRFYSYGDSSLLFKA